MRNFLQKIDTFKIIFIIFVIFFSITLFLSVPSLFNYNSLHSKLSKQIESDYNLDISNISKLTYRFVPAPHIIVESSELRLNKSDPDPIANLKNSKVFISIIELYKNRDFEIKKIKISDENLYFTKNSFKFLINHLGNENINNLVVEKSKFFFENNNKEISTISTINKLNYFQNFKTNQKKLKIKGDIFDTKFDFLWNKDLNKKDYTNFDLKFRNPNILFQNILYSEDEINKKGNLKISFLSNILNIDYNLNNETIKIESKSLKSSILLVNGSINKNPFYFNIETTIRNQKIKDLIKVILYNFSNYRDKIHKNLNGKLKLNFDTIQNAYLSSGNIFLDVSGSKLNILDNKIDIRNIGTIKMHDNLFYEDEGEIYFVSKLEIIIDNQDEFYRRFLVPIKNRINMKKMYMIFEKNIDKDIYSISSVNFNNDKDLVFNLDNIRQLPKNYFENFQQFRSIIKNSFN